MGDVIIQSFPKRVFEKFIQSYTFFHSLKTGAVVSEQVALTIAPEGCVLLESAHLFDDGVIDSLG